MITDGKWRASTELSGMITVRAGNTDTTADNVIAVIGKYDTDENKDNANLIAAAVNACIKLNPDDPMTVAEAINDMSEALQTAYDRLRGRSYYSDNECVKIIRKAIDRAKGGKRK